MSVLNYVLPSDLQTKLAQMQSSHAHPVSCPSWWIEGRRRRTNSQVTLIRGSIHALVVVGIRWALVSHRIAVEEDRYWLWI